MKTILNHSKIAHLALSMIAGLIALAQAQGAATNADPSYEAIRWDTLSVKVSTDKKIYEPGEPVTMILDARNEGDAPFRLDFVSGQRFDFTVFDAKGNALWSWAINKDFIFLMGTEILQPGASLRYQTDEFIAPERGVYTVEGRITSTEPFNRQSLFGVDVEPVSTDGIWSGEGQGYSGSMAPWHSWQCAVYDNLIYGEWSDANRNRGMFKGYRIESGKPNISTYEGEWIGYGFGFTSGRFTLEFPMGEEECSGHWFNYRHASITNSIRGWKQSGRGYPLGSSAP